MASISFSIPSSLSIQGVLSVLGGINRTPFAGTLAQICGPSSTAVSATLEAEGALGQYIIRYASAGSTAVANGASLGAYAWQGMGSSVFSTASRAYVQATALETWTNTAQGTMIEFFVTPAGGVATAVAAQIRNTGLTVIGQVATAASTTSLASLSLPHGSAPTSPVNGDVWTTTAGLFARINSVTIGPFGTGATNAANPSASVGLTTVNGSATTFMRSDAAPALDVSISPVWTNTHLFNHAASASGVVAINGNSSSVSPGANSGTLLVLQEADSTSGGLAVLTFAQFGSVGGYRTEGTNASKTATASGSELFRVGGGGYYVTGGPAYQSAFKAYISFFANENWTSVAQGTYCQVLVTPNGSSTSAVVAQFNSGGVAVTGTFSSSGIGAIGTSTSSSTTLNLPASTTTVSSIRLAHGAAPTSPVNGDFWSTTSGFFGQVNGSTVGPFGAGGGGGTPANPTASVGLTVVNGSASTYMRSDAAPALSQAITPNWTGAHIFEGNATFGKASGTTGAIVFKGTTSGAFTMSVNAAAGTWTAIWPSTAGTNTYVLTTDGSGNLSWSAPGGGGISGANPSASIGLTTVNGSATTFMRSDGAPPLDVSISPTWTGVHIFSHAASNSGVVQVNANSSAMATPLAGLLIAVQAADTVAASIAEFAYGNSTSFFGYRANGTSASKTATASGNTILRIGAGGYQTTTGAFTAARANIDFVATENWTSTAQGAKINIIATTTGNTTAVTHTFDGAGLAVTGGITGSSSAAGAFLFGGISSDGTHGFILGGTGFMRLDNSSGPAINLSRSGTITTQLFDNGSASVFGASANQSALIISNNTTIANFTSTNLTLSGTLITTGAITMNAAGPMVLDANSSVGLPSSFPAAFRQLVLYGDDTNPVRIFQMAFANAGVSITGLVYGGTRASPTATADAAILNRLVGSTYDGTSVNNTGVMSILSDGAQTTGNHGSRFVWAVTPNGSTTINNTAMILDGIGLTVNRLGVGNAPVSFIPIILGATSTASGGSCYGVLVGSTLNAAANSDNIVGVSLGSTSVTLAKSTFTGLTYFNVAIGAPTLSGTGTIALAYQLYIGAAPTATTKYGIYQAGTDANVLGGALTVGGALTSGSALTVSNGNFILSVGNIIMAGATNISMGNSGVGAPTFTTRSAGTKLNLYDQISGSVLPFSLGIESGAIWMATGSTANSIKFYTGTTNMATIDSTGISVSTAPSTGNNLCNKTYVDSVVGGTAYVVNVKAYGATGNGSIDDTAAVAAAVLATTNYSTLYFPSGKYKIDLSTIVFITKHHITIMGDGRASELYNAATTYAGNNYMILVDNSSDYFTIKNLSIICSITSRISGLHGIGCGAPHSLISGIYTTGTGDFGIVVGQGGGGAWSSDVQIVDCVSDSTRGDGFHMGSVKDSGIYNCIANNTGDDGLGIGDDGATGYPPTRVEVVGFHSYSSGGLGTSISGCGVRIFDGAVDIHVNGGSATNSLEAGLSCGRFSSTTAFNTRITINGFKAYGALGFQYGQINFQFCNQLLVQGCWSEAPTHNGCYGFLDCNNITVNGNTAKDGAVRGFYCDDGTTTNVASTCSNWTIIGNTCIGTPSNEAYYFVPPTGKTITNLIITGNTEMGQSASNYIFTNRLAGTCKINNNTSLGGKAVANGGSGSVPTPVNNN